MKQHNKTKNVTFKRSFLSISIALATPFLLAGCKEGDKDAPTPPPVSDNAPLKNEPIKNNDNNETKTTSKQDFSKINQNGKSIVKNDVILYSVKHSEKDEDLLSLTPEQKTKLEQDFISNINPKSVLKTKGKAFNVNSDVNTLDKFEAIMEKQVGLEEIDSYYIHSAEQGNLERNFVDSNSFKNKDGFFKINQSPKTGKDYISQTGKTSKESSLIFNTGMKDTSPKWTRESVEDAYKWDVNERLERDRIVNIKNVHNNGLVGDTDELANLVRDDVAKVIVTDTSTLGTLDFDYKRITHTAFHEQGEGKQGLGNRDNDNMNHGDTTIYAMMGKPHDKNYSNKYLENNYGLGWHGKGAQYFYPGFMTKAGKVAFYAQQKNYDGALHGITMMTSPELHKWVDEGFKILNMSWSYSNNPNVDKKNPEESWLQYYTRTKYRGDFFVDTARKLANKDVLMVNSLGNDYNKKVSMTAIGPYVHQDNKVLDSIIYVAAYDAAARKIADYSNHCEGAKEQCLTASTHFFPRYNDEFSHNMGFKNEQGFFGNYTTGTSNAAPYVSSTAAMVKSVFPWMTNNNLQQTLLTTAHDLGEEGIDKVYGWGLIQPQLAVHGPAQFYKKDFVVDFNHDNKYLDKHQVFRFSNDIKGTGGLIVKGNDKFNVLSLSGNNHYTGDTVLQNGALVNIDGINNQSHVKIVDGHLFGSGLLGHVYNNGSLHNYSYFANSNPNDVRSQYGMVIEGDYIQTNKGILNVSLGQPLLVKGYASLDGVLNITGVKSAYVSKFGKIFDDVLLSQKGIAGKFNLVGLPSLLKNPELTYNVQNLGDNKRLYSVTLFTTYGNLTDNVRTFTAMGSYDYDLLINSASNIEAITASLDNVVEKALQNNNLDNASKEDKARYADEFVKQNLASGLATFVGNIQNSLNDMETAKVLDHFAGKEIVKSLENSQHISTLNQFNALNLGDKDGVSYQHSFLGKDGHLNTLAFNKKDKENGVYLGVQYSIGQLKDKDLEDKSNKMKTQGFNFTLGKTLTDDKNTWLNASIGYDFYKDKNNRSINLFGQNEDLNEQEMKHKNLSASLYLTHKHQLNDKHSIEPFVGYTFEDSTIKQYNEHYQVSEFDFGLNRQDIKNHYGFIGFGYEFKPVEDLNVKLHYLYKQQLNGNKTIDGYFKDNNVQSNHKFDLNNKRQHVAKAEIEKRFDNFKVGLNVGLHKDKKSEALYGLKVSYNF